MGDAVPQQTAPQLLPMETAPKDGTIVRLLVDYSGEDACHPLEDANQAWTVGGNTDGNTGADLGWRFAGWDWSQDQFCEGKGTPIGWLPFADHLSHWPTAKLTVHGGRVSATLYAPGLPDGQFDTWLQPMPAAEHATGQLHVAAQLLNAALGPLEVSAALIEDEDGDTAMESLISDIKAFVAAYTRGRAQAVATPTPLREPGDAQ